MNLLHAIILGFIQGLTEFLPVSSSGHLVFLPKIFGWGDQGLSFDVILHLGSLTAVVIYFRNKLWKMIKGVVLVKSKKYKVERKLAWLIVLTIIPAGIIGLLFNDWIETNLRSSVVIGVGLIFWGMILYFAEKFNQKSEIKNLKSLNWKQALFIGCAQAIALIPGTSRSGITMTAGLFSKLDKKSVAEFSFLMSVPIILLAGALNFLDLIKVGLGDLTLGILLVGFLSAFFSGLVAIAGLMKIIQKWSFKPFVVYRVVVGILILLLL